MNTGEVVAGDPTTGQRLVTGDAVNVAARLEQAAGAQEMLLGRPPTGSSATPSTSRRSSRWSSRESPSPCPPTASSASRGRRAARGASTRRSSAATQELGSSRQHSRARRRRASCRLVTVLGDAGVGKSRLVESSCGRSARRGSCAAAASPTATGITFWPLVEAVRQAAGIPERRLDRRGAGRSSPRSPGCRVEATASPRRSACRTSSIPVEELFWGARKLFEALARRAAARRPLRGRPLGGGDVPRPRRAPPRGRGRTLPPARLPDRTSSSTRRTGRPGGRDRGRARAALRGRGGARGRAPARRGRARRPCPRARRRAAEGNPLFVEQLLSMLIDDGLIRFEDGYWRASADLDRAVVPPTIQALLAARLDCLEHDERAVIEPAAVDRPGVRRGRRDAPRPATAYRDWSRLASVADGQAARQPDLSRSLEEEASASTTSSSATRPTTESSSVRGDLPRALRRMGRQRQPRGRDRVRGDPRATTWSRRTAIFRARPARRPRPRVATRCRSTRLAAAGQRPSAAETCRQPQTCSIGRPRSTQTRICVASR